MERGVELEFRECIRDIMSNSTRGDDFLACIDLLQIRRDQFNIIHVSGTNGKSSVSHKVAQCLASLGKTVGLFTSPHLFDYNERIRVQGVEISKADFVRLSKAIRAKIGDISLHFFSFLLLLALLYFIEHRVEWIVLETGIGGLYDKTNFATNTRIVVISSIGFDHMAMLGNTLDEIAFQKAGTIKPGSMVVLGPNCHRDEIFESIARDVGGRVIKNKGKDFKSFEEENTETARLVIEEALKMGVAPLASLRSRLKMRMQVLTAEQLSATKSHIFSKFTHLSGKVTEYGNPRAVILDIGHNETAIQRLCSDILRVYQGDLRYCGAISLRRRLSIFNPIASTDSKSAQGGPAKRRFYYLSVNHDYCRKLRDVFADLDDPEMTDELRTLAKEGLERSLEICTAEEGHFHTSEIVNNDFDKVLYNAFIESCRSSDTLVLTGTAYMMDNAVKSLGLRLSD